MRNVKDWSHVFKRTMHVTDEVGANTMCTLTDYLTLSNLNKTIADRA